MTDALQNLEQALEEWREQKNQAAPPKPKNPYGHKIYQLNMEWHETKKAHMAKLAEEEAKYREAVATQQRLSTAWELDNRPQRPSAVKRGPVPVEHSDEVKMAAAQALRDGYNRSLVRAILGISKTPLLDKVLRDGEELLQAQEQAKPTVEEAGW